MMRDQDFCSELSDLFKNFSTFCFNHNDFSRLNDNIMRTLLESFACNFTLLKHKPIYKHFHRKYKGTQFFQDFTMIFLRYINTLKKTSITTKKSFWLLKSSLLSLSKNFAFDNIFEKNHHFKLDIHVLKECIFFLNRFLLDKTLSSHVLIEWYRTCGI